MQARHNHSRRGVHFIGIMMDPARLGSAQLGVDKCIQKVPGPALVWDIPNFTTEMTNSTGSEREEKEKKREWMREANYS